MYLIVKIQYVWRLYKLQPNTYISTQKQKALRSKAFQDYKHYSEENVTGARGFKIEELDGQDVKIDELPDERCQAED